MEYVKLPAPLAKPPALRVAVRPVTPVEVTVWPLCTPLLPPEYDTLALTPEAACPDSSKPLTTAPLQSRLEITPVLHLTFSHCGTEGVPWFISMQKVLVLKIRSPVAGADRAFLSAVLRRDQRKPFSVLCKSSAADGSGVSPPNTTCAARPSGPVTSSTIASCMIVFVMFSFISSRFRMLNVGKFFK
jgi:hypothetical protein